MTTKQLLTYIFLKYAMFAALIYVTINSVQRDGWDFFPILFVLLATREFVQGTRLVQVYYKIKKNYKV